MANLIVLDTCVVLDFLAGVRHADTTEKIIRSGRGAVSAITVYELFNGVTEPKQLEQRSTLLSFVQVMAIDQTVARLAAGICTALKAAGTLIPHEDMLLAAGCIHNTLQLFTTNTRDFEQIEGLTLYSP
jgi:predicted nucleic acid-binding protein